MAKAALQELVRLQKQTSNRAAPKWACNCGFKTNFSDRNSCYRCLAKKGEGKGPAAVLPSQHVHRKPNPIPATASATQSQPEVEATPLGIDVDLEACRRSAVDRLRHLRLLQDATPSDPSFARWAAETETELSVIKGKLHALKTSAARLQACLTKKAGADKEVANAEAAARAATEVLDLAKGRLVAATDAQAALERELRDLRLDGLLGPEAAATVQTPNPVDLLKFATAILAAVAPSATIPPEVLQQMAVMCNLCAPPAQAEHPPGGTATPNAEKKTRSRSPSASATRVQEAPAVRAAKAVYEAALAAAALEAQNIDFALEGADSVFGTAGGVDAMEVTDSGATQPAGRVPVLVAPRVRA